MGGDGGLRLICNKSMIGPLKSYQFGTLVTVKVNWVYLPTYKSKKLLKKPTKPPKNTQKAHKWPNVPQSNFFHSSDPQWIFSELTVWGLKESLIVWDPKINWKKNPKQPNAHECPNVPQNNFFHSSDPKWILLGLSVRVSKEPQIIWNPKVY